MSEEIKKRTSNPRRQTTETIKKLYDGKLRIERRNGSTIYARAFLQGKNVVKPTGERDVELATDIATRWYLNLLDRIRKGENLHGKTFAEMAEAFLIYADRVCEVSEGQRRQYHWKWSLLKPYFTEPHAIKVTGIDTKFLLALREARSKALTNRGKPVKLATLKKDMNFIRMVLRHAKDIEKAIEKIPEFPSFRGEQKFIYNVYIFSRKDDDKFLSPVKIGYSNNIEWRLQTIQTGNPDKLYVYKAISFQSRKEALSVEKTFHERMERFRLNGEWYSLTPELAFEEVSDIVRELCIESMGSK